MTREKSARRKRHTPAARPAGSWVTIAVAVLVVVATALAIGIWRRQAGPLGTAIHPGVLRDSLSAAEARGDWVAGLAWAERLAAAEPRDAGALRDLSVAWHNRATLERPSPVGPRSALRNSIERAACELRAFTLAESAASVALNPEDWGNAERWRGQMLEYIGLPGDASTTYDGILRRRADDGDARLRMMWLLVHLRDPQAPDRIQLNPNAGRGP